jgi:UDPglucose 6-dehydrogenase
MIIQNTKSAVWGLAFKPDTDDMRDAPSRMLMEGLWDRGAYVQAYDPAAMEETRRIYSERADLQLCNDPCAACQDASVLVICTEWQIFRSPDFERLKNLLRRPLIIDGRNLYDPVMLFQVGFDYRAIGRSLQSMAGCSP